MLEKEYKFYTEHKQEFVQKYLNKFVVIKGNKLINVYNTQSEAILEASKEYELGTFLVHQVLEDEPQIVFHSRVLFNGKKIAPCF